MSNEYDEQTTDTTNISPLFSALDEPTHRHFFYAAFFLVSAHTRTRYYTQLDTCTTLNRHKSLHSLLVTPWVASSRGRARVILEQRSIAVGID